MTFAGDNRGVSAVVGAIFIFAFVVIGFSIYQAEIVPGENQQVEFKHYQNVQGDLQDLRNAIISGTDGDTTRSARIQLGTEYPTRVMTVQPSSPTGRLSTETIGSGEIAISGVNETQVCGIGETATTKSIQYTPYYNYLSGTPPTTYENTVLYRQNEDGAVIYESGQTLVSGSTVNLYPLVGNYSESGSVSTVIDVHGSATGSTVVSDSVTLTIPTRLSPQQWHDLLNESTDNVVDVTENTTRESAVDITLKTGFYQIRCTPVGTDTNPDANPTLQIGGDGSDVNPTEAGNIILENETRQGGNQAHIVDLVLNNTGETSEDIRRARINFFQDASGGGGNAPTYAELQAPDGTVAATLQFGGSYQTVNPKITLEFESETPVTLAFYAENGNDANLKSQDWFVVSFQYTNASDGTYFVQVPE